MHPLPRRGFRSLNIWPGFVDALAALLMTLIFVLLVFVLAQFFLSELLSGRESTIRSLQGELAQLVEQLKLEQREKEDISHRLAVLSDELQASLQVREQLAAAVAALTESAGRADRLATEVAALEALKAQLEREAAALVARSQEAESALIEERKLSESARAQIALLNQQIAAVREQLRQLTAALDAAERKAADQEVQIKNLGERLNAALASKVQELARYRSEFFGRLREILGDRSDVRIVGDRFIFSSEVLFATASADLDEEGQRQIVRVAQALKEVAAKIPSDIHWILQVEGHTDKVPISTPQFPSNWELSTARAMSVIRLLTANGIPADRLSAAGYGEFHPLESGATAAELRRNRRIELKLTQR